MRDSCQFIHHLAGELERYEFPFEPKRLPDDGIYLLLEAGETGHGVDRIVRVGTHTGEGRLRQRLQEHFNIPNKDRSIFRKNIGRAILYRERDPFLEQWNYDLTTKRMREEYGPFIDLKKQNAVEENVTEQIRKVFSFVVLPVKDKNDRVRFESAIISTVSLCEECGPSHQWLGKYSPNREIRNSGLWQEKELYKRENCIDLRSLSLSPTGRHSG